MWVRKRLDISWLDLLCAAGWSMTARDQRIARADVERHWRAGDRSFACLSVRTGWDLFLAAAQFPRGSEVLVSAMTIPDMVRIIEHHGLVGVPLDIDPHSALPPAEQIAARTTQRTKAVLVAHLFGTAAPLDAHIASAHKLGLLFAEDCAQAFRGVGWTGHPDADLSMFSFGTIKTATALGGALLTVRSRELLERMRALEEKYPLQSRGSYLRRVAKCMALKAASARWGTRTLVTLLRLAGRDHDRLLNSFVRGFDKSLLLEMIRRRASAPLLKLLGRRIAMFCDEQSTWRAARGRRLAASLRSVIECPAAEAPSHMFWVFPVLADEPASLEQRLLAHGFDSTQGQSMIVVPPPAGRPDWIAHEAMRMLWRIRYLPFYDALPDAELDRLAKALRCDDVREARARSALLRPAAGEVGSFRRRR